MHKHQGTYTLKGPLTVGGYLWAQSWHHCADVGKLSDSLNLSCIVRQMGIFNLDTSALTGQVESKINAA